MGSGSSAAIAGYVTLGHPLPSLVLVLPILQGGVRVRGKPPAPILGVNVRLRELLAIIGACVYASAWLSLEVGWGPVAAAPGLPSLAILSGLRALHLLFPLPGTLLP